MTLKEFWASATALGKFCMGVAILLLAYTIFAELSIYFDSSGVAAQIQLLQENQPMDVKSLLLQQYIYKMPVIWYSVFILLAIGLFQPYKESFNTEESLEIQFGVSVAAAILFLVVSLFYLSRQVHPGAGTYTVIVGVFSVLSVSIGWLINSQISRRHERKTEARANRHHTRSHTLNIILQLNTSSDFHEKNQMLNSVYPVHSIIPDEDVKVYLTSSGEFKNDPDKKKQSAMTSLSLMLDTYEFIFEGIAQGDLDEDVIYESLGGAILRNVKRASNLINSVRQGAHTNKPMPKVFCRLVEFYYKWEPKHRDESNNYHENIRPITPLA